MTKRPQLFLKLVILLASSWWLVACQQEPTARLTPTAVSQATQSATATATLVPTNEPTVAPPSATNAPTASATAVPLPAVTLTPPRGRAELITMLRQVQTEVIGLAETQQQLLTFPRLDDPEWAGDVAIQAAFIQATRLALESLTLPAAGQTLAAPLQTAVLACEEAALAEDLEGLANCLDGLQTVSLGNGGNGGTAVANPNVVTPIPLVGCSQTSVGFVPLTDLGTGLHMGAQGGLYPNGQNTPPTDHLAAGLAQAQAIQPLASDGSPAADGKIGFVSVGMSNAALEFNAFLRLANDDPAKNESVVLVNGAQGGWTSNKLAEDPNAEYWQVLDERLADNGLTPAQVQVVWL
ncbi:MAG: hypothetical protein KC449_22835, partial [Anaerolineales bacterium]|nr:hypothetical protein [Anaerolineales bacterium]